MKPKIEAAPQNTVIALEPYIYEVLEAIGHPEAWVSDMSSIGDFRPIDFTGESEGDLYQQFVNEVSNKLSIKINKGEYIINIAARLKEFKQQNEHTNSGETL